MDCLNNASYALTTFENIPLLITRQTKYLTLGRTRRDGLNFKLNGFFK